MIPTRNTTTEATIQMLVDALLDFVNKLFLTMVHSSLPKNLKISASQEGIQHVYSAPYHPQSNGEPGKFLQTFKSAMQKAKQGGMSKLCECLFSSSLIRLFL